MPIRKDDQQLETQPLAPHAQRLVPAVLGVRKYAGPSHQWSLQLLPGCGRKPFDSSQVREKGVYPLGSEEDRIHEVKQLVRVDRLHHHWNSPIRRGTGPLIDDPSSMRILEVEVLNLGTIRLPHRHCVAF